MEHANPSLRAQRADATRDRILHAAFLEFFRQAFQGGNLSRIIAAAGITKGGLFHHFAGKTELGYAVVDEVIGPLLATRWVDPVADTDDPIPALQAAYRRHAESDLDSGHWVYGCPLNNLAQEMAPLDAGFHARINGLYDRWREAWAAALERGQGAGTVKRSVSPPAVAAFLVASQMGIWGTGKSSQNRPAMLQATQGVCDYLETLKP